MKLPMPKSESLAEYIHERELMTYQDRMELHHPPILDKKDAVIYWLHIYRQDNPVLLFLGLVAIIAMPISILFRVIMSLIGA